mmetsp:Transcript_8619/g.18961  ORF Transcript_8619/g.18961 Transcript_8619/m.18961 type:complete len:276 (+) Transcript_8619:606-1433(+)
MLNENPEYITFCPGGTKEHPYGRIIVHDRKKVESKILPRYFSHSSFASLRRQLNYFAWTRIGKGRQRHAVYLNKYVIVLEDIMKLKRRIGVSLSPPKSFPSSVISNKPTKGSLPAQIHDHNCPNEEAKDFGKDIPQETTMNQFLFLHEKKNILEQFFPSLTILDNRALQSILKEKLASHPILSIRNEIGDDKSPHRCQDNRALQSFLKEKLASYPILSIRNTIGDDKSPHHHQETQLSKSTPQFFDKQKEDELLTCSALLDLSLRATGRKMLIKQ